MIVKQLASQPDLHGFNAHSLLLGMASSYQHDEVCSNRPFWKAHLITTRKRKGTLGEGWEGRAAS